MGTKLSQYQLFPELTSSEFAELLADIDARGVQVAVEYDEDGNILDGHHRVKACEQLGITDFPSVVRYGMTEEEKRHHVRKLNLARRHLTSEQRNKVILDMRAEGKSYREIGKTVGVDPMTGRISNAVDEMDVRDITSVIEVSRKMGGRAVEVTQELIDRAKAYGACSDLPDVGSTLDDLTFSQLAWIDDAGLLTAEEREAIGDSGIALEFLAFSGSGDGDGYGDGYGSGE